MDPNHVVSGSYFDTNYTSAENQNFTVQFSAITEKMAISLDNGFSVDSQEMQAAVREHYEFCLQFWEPDSETFKSLAMNYILPTGYRDTYEAVRQGLGKYIYQAVCHFADTELAEQGPPSPPSR